MFEFPEEILKTEPEYIDELELINGTTVSLNCNLSLAQMKRYTAQGYISNDTLKMMLNGKLGEAIDTKSIDNAPFVAYQAAGGQMTKDEFDEQVYYEFDTFMQIYTQLITSKRTQQNNHFRDKLKSATKK